MEVIGILFMIALVVGVFTVIGHGIWVAAAWVLRGGKRRSEVKNLEPNLNDDRAATARYLYHLQTLGLVDEADRLKMMAALSEEARSRFDGARRAAPAGSAEKTSEDAIAAWKRKKHEVDEQAPIAQPEPPPHEFVPEVVADDEAEAGEWEETWNAEDEAVDAPAVGHRAADRPWAPPPPAAPPPQQVAPPPPPAEPKRPFAAVLASFMAEKNIRWGEIIGGLLIVGSSTALVISLWSQIESIPVLKFLIFCGVTAALSGAGLFIFHRWKLPTTGHALLVTSTLLVPLNLLAFAAFSKQGEPPGGVVIGAEVAAIALFGWLTLLGGRVIMPGMPRLFAAGITALSASTLLIRYLSPEDGAKLLAIGSIPVGLYLIVMAVSLRRWSGGEPAEGRTPRPLLLQLGVQTFACLVAFGFLVYQAGAIQNTLRELSPLCCAVAIPALVIGLYLWRRYPGEIATGDRMIAGTIAQVAAAVMLACVVMSWPMPSRLVPVLLINALAMAGLARLSRHPASHVAMSVWLSAAWVFLVHLVFGRIEWNGNESEPLIAALGSSLTGQALVAVVLAFVGIAILLEKRGRATLAVAYGVSSLAMMAISVAVVTWFGFTRPGDPEHTLWVYLLYAVGAFIAACRLRSAIATWCSGVMALMGAAEYFVYVRPLQEFAWPTALLIVSSVASLVALVVTRFRHSDGWSARAIALPLTQLALVLTLAGLCWMASPYSTGSTEALAVRVAWTAVIWGVLAVAQASPETFAAAQGALFLAAGIGAHVYIRRQTWYPDAPWFEPWVWQIQAIVLGAGCVVWSMVRLAMGKAAPKMEVAAVDVGEASKAESAESVGDPPPVPSPSIAHRLLNPRFLAVDQIAGVILAVSAMLLAAWAIQPVLLLEHAATSISAFPGPHVHAAGYGSWIVIGVVALTLSIHWLNRRRREAIHLALLCLVAMSALAAVRFEADRQTVNVWRWILAGLFMACSILVAIWRARPVSRIVLEQALSRRAGVTPAELSRHAFLLFAVPTLILSISAAIVISNNGGTFDLPASAPMLRVWLMGPAIIVALALLGFGFAMNQPIRAVETAGLACMAVTGTEITLISRSGVRFGVDDFAWWVQLNSFVCAAAAMAWCLLSQIRRPGREGQFPAWPLLVFRVGNGLVLLLSAVMIWFSPEVLSPSVDRAGSIWSILAIASVELALYFACRRSIRAESPIHTTVWVWYAVVFAASATSSTGWDTPGSWVAFHTLMAGLGLSGAVLLVIGARQVRAFMGGDWQETFDSASSGSADTIEHDLTCTACGYNLRGLEIVGTCPECNAPVAESRKQVIEKLTPHWNARLARLRSYVTGAVMASVIFGTLYAMRGAIDDPQEPWWSVALSVILSATTLAVAAWAPKRSLAYMGALELCLAASLLWWSRMKASGTGLTWEEFTNLAGVNIAAISLVGIVWLELERWRLTALLTPIVGRAPAGFHHVAAMLTTTAVLGIAGLITYAVAAADPIVTVTAADWIGWTAATLLMIACTARSDLPNASAGLYMLGLAGLALLTANFGVEPKSFAWILALELSGYVLFTSAVWRWWTRNDRSTRAAVEAHAWLMVANAGLTIAAGALAVYINLTHTDRTIRLAMCIAPLVCAAGLFRLAHGERIRNWLAGALLTAGLSAILLPWAWLAPDAPEGILQRAILLVASAVGLILVFTAMTRSLDPGRPLRGAIRSAAIGVAAITACAIGYVCYENVRALAAHVAVPIDPGIRWTLIAALAILTVSLVFFAIREQFDPFHTPLALRGGLIYAAETLVAAIALHVRATMPWLFHGTFTQYWPLIVMGLAFLALAAGELLERRNAQVLSKPLGRTGVFLPAIALLEILLASSRVHFTIILLTAGTFYAVVSAIRRSPLFGLLSSMLFTGSLWYWLHHTEGLDITRHPQLWFIPPALAILVAGHLSRSRLSAAQRKAVNYSGLIAIYVSSTADIFLVGVSTAPWLPLVLAGLSVAGILIGIGFRLLSFLQLGTGFLCLSLLTIVWHAAADLGWTWVWYVAGIGLGALIITLFALFEKKRNEMMAMLSQVREWHG